MTFYKNAIMLSTSVVGTFSMLSYISHKKQTIFGKSVYNFPYMPKNAYVRMELDYPNKRLNLYKVFASFKNLKEENSSQEDSCAHSNNAHTTEDNKRIVEEHQTLVLSSERKDLKKWLFQRYPYAQYFECYDPVPELKTNTVLDNKKTGSIILCTHAMTNTTVNFTDLEISREVTFHCPFGYIINSDESRTYHEEQILQIQL